MHGKKLIELRKKMVFTRRRAVEELNKIGLDITQQTLLNWEIDKFEPSFLGIQKLAQIYKVPLETFTS